MVFICPIENKTKKSGLENRTIEIWDREAFSNT